MRPIYQIAIEIDTIWSQAGKGVNYAARPYLDALKDLYSIESTYGHDSARSIILYFLGNAASFRGDAAKRLKAELRDHLNPVVKP